MNTKKNNSTTHIKRIIIIAIVILLIMFFSVYALAKSITNNNTDTVHDIAGQCNPNFCENPNTADCTLCDITNNCDDCASCIDNYDCDIDRPKKDDKNKISRTENDENSRNNINDDITLSEYNNDNNGNNGSISEGNNGSSNNVDRNKSRTNNDNSVNKNISDTNNNINGSSKNSGNNNNGTNGNHSGSTDNNMNSNNGSNTDRDKNGNNSNNTNEGKSDNNSNNTDEGKNDNNTRTEYPGTISIVNHDDMLRIGAELTFAASDDQTDFFAQWRVDGEDVRGANGMTYTVRPDDADKKISVYLVSKCDNYEITSPSTGYVPYTITVSVNQNFTPIEGDRVFIGTHGNYTAYAASKDNGYVTIGYELQNSGFGTDTLEFSGSNIFGANSAGAGVSKYYPNVHDAYNGVITISATFYHRGATISPVGSSVFTPISCGDESDEVHIFVISQVGNAPTGPLHITKNGNNPEAFTLHTNSIPSLNIGETYELEVRTGLVSSPPPFVTGHMLSAEVDLSGEHISNSSIPVSMNVSHIWGVWGDWMFIDRDIHTRAGFCISCNRPGGVEVGPHIWGNWGAWGSDDGTLFTTTHCRRHGSCTDCGHTTHDDIPHSWAEGWTYNSEFTHSRPCTRCDTHQHQLHILENWQSTDPNSCVRQCSSCTHEERVSHSFSPTHHTSTDASFSNNMYSHVVYQICPRCGRTHAIGSYYCVFSQSTNTCVRSSINQFPGIPESTIIVGYGGCGQIRTRDSDNLFVD